MKKHFYCMRCGQRKAKGFTDAGCNTWGRHYKKHIWKLSDDSGIEIRIVGPEERRFRGWDKEEF